MDPKKPTTRPRSVRSVLGAERRLQKISLRRIQERMAKLREPQARSPQPKHPLLATPPVPPPPRAYSWRAIVVGAACLLAAAALMTARQGAEEGDATAAGPASIAAASVENPIAAPPAPKKPGVSTPAGAKPVATRTTPADSAAEAPAHPPITITGCLERDGDAYWLKETSGADVPKARSWKTGFLKRRAPRIELIDTSAALRLSTHLGERVAATGTLEDRELRARSLRRVGGGCE